MTSQRLSRPAPLPARFAPLARAITGRTQLPRFTSGVATRAALRASGARAATTGVTLHLPTPPDGSPRSRSVVAHELSHIRDAIRPRPPGVPLAATGQGRLRGSASLPDSAPHFLLDQLSGVVDAGERRARAVSSAARKSVTDAGSDLARGAYSAIEQRAPSVRDLPVGGLAPMLARASAVARETATDVAGQAAAMPDRSDAVLAAARAAGNGLLPSVAAPAGMLVAAADRAEAQAQTWQSAEAGGPASPPVEATAASPSAGGGNSDLAGRADELLEILEDRLIAELERRGGRFAGVF